MPRATVSKEPVRYDLKTVPGGYVSLKQLPYSQAVARRDMGSRMAMEGAAGDNKFSIEFLQRQVRSYEFANCIVDHNLTDDNDQPLNFQNPMTLDVLDPRVGAEIERHIDQLNTEESPEEEQAFTRPSFAASTETDEG